MSTTLTNEQKIDLKIFEHHIKHKYLEYQTKSRIYLGIKFLNFFFSPQKSFICYMLYHFISTLLLSIYEIILSFWNHFTFGGRIFSSQCTKG